MKAEQIQQNWDKLLKYIEENVTGERKERLLDFYKKYEDRLSIMPASNKKQYHNAFPGGYVDHVIRVIECSFDLYSLWKSKGADISTFTKEELFFSALNHDLGKMGSSEEEAFIPQTDSWRKDKLGEDYTFNTKLEFASVPDRGLFLLQSHGVQYTFNEMVAIQTHDGLYDEANKKYLMSFLPEAKPRTCLPYIIHQADLMAARIEFEREWLSELNGANKPKQTEKPKKVPVRQKALKQIQNPNLAKIFDKL